MAKSSKDYGVAIECFQKALTEHRNLDTLKELMMQNFRRMRSMQLTLLLVQKANSDVSQGEREGSFAVDPGGESEELIKRQEEEKSCPVDIVISNPHSTEVGSGTGLETLNNKQVVAEDYRGAESEKIPQNGNTGAELPLNCDDYSSAVALENFGMEKL
ncbi:hypothetical protein Droror1_Dr00022593 [Drosera rotundifolia]